MLKLEKVTKKYIDSDKKEVLAVNNVTYKYKDKGLVLIKGKSGSGKTTLLNLISSDDYPTSGSVYFNDLEISNKKEKLINQYKKQIIGYVFQDHNLLEDYTVYENIEFALSIQGKSINEDKVIKYLEKVELTEEYLDKYPDELSGGEQQRVAILRALMKDSKIILADEPTSALDSETKSEIYKILKEISKDKLVILSSHDYEKIEEYADVVLKMENGILTEEFNNKGIKETNNKYQLEEVKTKTNLKYFFKNLKNILFKRIPRYLVMMVLLLTGTIALAYSLVHLTIDKTKALEESVLNNDIKELSISYLNDKTIQNFDDDTFKAFTDKLKGVDFFKIYNNGYATDIEISNLNSDKTKSNYYSDYIWGIVQMKDDIDLKRYDLELIAGSRPKKNKEVYEVLITEYIYEHYKDFGYRYDNEATVINKYEDLIGKTIDTLKGKKIIISGIVKTNSSYERYSYAKEKLNDLTDQKISSFKKESRNGLIYTIDDFDIDYKYKVMVLTKNLSRKNIQDIIKLSDDGEIYINTYEFAKLGQNIKHNSQKVLIAFGIIAFVTIFSIILTISQINFIMIKSSKDIGVMKSLGVKNNYIKLLFLILMIIFVVVIGVINFITSGVIVDKFNERFNSGDFVILEVYSKNLTVIILPIIWLIVVSTIGIFLPLNKKLKENTTSILGKRE